MRQVGLKRMLYGSDTLLPGGPTLSGIWALHRAKLGFTDAELRTLATNRTRFIR